MLLLQTSHPTQTIWNILLIHGPVLGKVLVIGDYFQGNRHTHTHTTYDDTFLERLSRDPFLDRSDQINISES